jgi:hypothetical protein
MVEVQAALAAKIEELREALEQIKSLRGILPICMHCKKICDDRGYWNQLETYIRRYSEAQFRHGICPECLGKYYPELAKDGENCGTDYK